MNTLIKIIMVVIMTFSVSALAHVSLKASMPTDNAMLMKSPETLSLSFTKNVKIVKLSLKNKQGEKIKFGFKPTKESNSEFSWKLPKLAPANYIVEATFLGKDGHKMKESFGFMVH